MIPISPLWSRAFQAPYAALDADFIRVLVVEDDLMVGAVAAEALQEAGFMVLSAASAEEAEIILSQEMIDVLFTGIDLGGAMAAISPIERSRHGLIFRSFLLRAAHGGVTQLASQRVRRFSPSLTACRT
jgi:DNA-binding NtrC family response regulator